MKLLSSLPVVAWSLTATLLGSACLRAQYNPPPPPEEQQGTMNQPAPDQGGPPPGEPNAAPPSYDPNAAAPATDQYGAPMNQAPPSADPNAGSDQGAPPSDQADGSAQDQAGDANFQTFYDNLSSQGSWVQTSDYGYVWQPNEDDPDWAPYTNGHWVYTDEGWAWVADESEPWGWATYHYGRWVNLDNTGWVWVPGYTWAPAWVSWRYGGGYCGWAPLPPATFVGIDFGGQGYGFHIGGDCDTAYDIGPGYYHFVPVGYLGARDYRGHYLDRNNNYAFIGRTRNVTNIVVNNQAGSGRFGRVRAGGPSFAAVNAQAQTPVQHVTLARSQRVGNAQLAGNRLSVFAPRVAAAGSAASFRPRNLAGNLSNVRVNNGANINQPLAVNARVRPSGPTSAQVQAAQAAHLTTQARVATPSTRPTQTLSQPLTRYQPHAATENRTHAASAPATVSRTSSAHVRPESAFTGGESEHVHASHQTAPDTEVHQAASPAAASFSHPNEYRSTAPEHREASPSIQPAVQHQAFSQPVSHQEAHPQIEPQHAAPQVQHQDFHPQQAAHSAAPPAHAGPHAGPGGKHDEKKDEQKQ